MMLQDNLKEMHKVLLIMLLRINWKDQLDTHENATTGELVGFLGGVSDDANGVEL